MKPKSSKSFATLAEVANHLEVDALIARADWAPAFPQLREVIDWAKTCAVGMSAKYDKPPRAALGTH